VWLSNVTIQVAVGGDLAATDRGSTRPVQPGFVVDHDVPAGGIDQLGLDDARHRRSVEPPGGKGTMILIGLGASALGLHDGRTPQAWRRRGSRSRADGEERHDAEPPRQPCRKRHHEFCQARRDRLLADEPCECRCLFFA